MNRLPLDDPRCLHFNSLCFGAGNRPRAVDGISQRVDDTADETFADWHFRDPAGALDDIAFLDLGGLTHENRTDAVLFEVERDSLDVMREEQELSGRDLLKAVNTGNPVTDRDDRADFSKLDARLEVLDLFAQNPANFLGFNVHSLLPFLSSFAKLLR